MLSLYHNDFAEETVSVTGQQLFIAGELHADWKATAL